MDNRVIELWKEKICMVHVAYKSKSALLLDQMKSHIHPDFTDSVDNLSTCAVEILGDLHL